MEEAFFFEHDGYRLLAMAHRPERGAARTGVVVCHPYGEEKQLSYPVLVRIARLLASDGHPVLRFDCRGYGDSAGALEDATLESHVAETLAAVALARARLGVERPVLLGLRFGALVAALAAERDPALAGLALWCPIGSGARWVDDMMRKRLFAEMLLKRKTSRAEIEDELARTGRLEIEGNFLTQELARAVGAVELVDAVRTFRNPVLVATVQQPGNAYAPFEAVARAYEAAGASATFEVAAAQPFWERNAMYDLYVPDDLFARTRRWMQALDAQ